MSDPKEKQGAVREQGLVRFGLGLANWSERWFPDPLIFALIGIVVVFAAGLLLRESPAKLAIQGGKNFWTLVPFTMQMVMIISAGTWWRRRRSFIGRFRRWREFRRRRAARWQWWRCFRC